jgi:CheY-like chemotaxis protein
MTGLRVVIVDDVADIRSLIGLLLAEKGHQVVGEAADGREAVEVVLSLSPDVVIMDWQMPVMDGLEATRRICEQSPGMRVVAYSSADDPVMRAAFLDAGAIAYHDKTDIAGLESAIAQVAALVRP